MNIKQHPVLEISGLGVSFGQRVILDGVTLSLSPKGVDVLMGPVKSGKSTLLRTLAGLYEGHSLHKTWGSVCIAGENLSDKNRPTLVHQHAKASNKTLLQTLLQPLRETEQRSGAEWHRLGLEWMATYGLGEYIAQADLPIMQCPLHLQRAVLILAQALLKPNILLIDEPTFSLAEENAALLVDWLKQLSTHCKLCVTLHNQKQARNLADRIVLIGGGRVLAHQETSLFFKQPANEWVENFIRTGSLPLPSPDAREQDLESDAVAPPLLSEAAQLAVQDHTASQPVAIASEPTAASAYKSTNIPTQIYQVSASSTADPAREKPAATIRNPVELPMASQNGVELASGIGEIIFRDSSAPRGFHWIVPGKLAGCPAPGVSAAIAYDLALLEKAGITMLVTLTETDLDQTVLAKYHLRNMHLPIYDRESPSVAQTHMLLVRMQRAIEQGEVLAVHCKAGLGRTGTILAAWMIREGGLSARGAMERLRRIEPGYIQSEVQENFLKYYEEDINRRLI